ncbi:MAG: glycosyltransferase family 39 protein [Anaerolineae bacterium]|nr:glycosyltransferase family 39 protein [Anaerolineae bacterium]
MTSRQSRLLAITTGVLLLIAASRIIHLNAMEMNWDEIWSIWQTFGSPADILRWTPFDWPPLYFLGLGGWKELVGIYPLVLRYFSALGFLLGCACFYRVGKRIWNPQVGVLVSLIYAALGFSMFMSLLVRGYAFLMALTPLALWLAIRYFDHPSIRRAVWLALCLAAMFYIHLISVFVFALVGLYTLLIYRRAIWRWWLPGVIGGALALPELIRKWAVLGTRTNYNATLPLPPLPEALIKMFSTYAGPSVNVWAVLFVLATAVIVIRSWPHPLTPSPLRSEGEPDGATPRSLRLLSGGEGLKAIFVLLWLLSPIAVYVLHSRLGLFQDMRYLWWVTPGLALWIGVGLAKLPRMSFGLITALIVVLLLLPPRLDDYQDKLYHGFSEPFNTNFQLLKQYMQPSDVILLDPNCRQQCAPLEAWDYFMRIYFPNGLPFVNEPGDHRRIWYVSRDWGQDPTTRQLLMLNRVPGMFFGPPTFLFRLYEGPPNLIGIPFANGMRFHGADIDGVPTHEGVVMHEGQTVHLRLWWSIDKPIDRDYSISLRMIMPNDPVQLDGPPQVQDAPSETSRWQQGRYYIDKRTVQLPYPLKASTYSVLMAVYHWSDQKRIEAPGVDQNTLLPIQTVTIQSWSSGW